jgi:DNA mismatch repair protein MutS2
MNANIQPNIYPSNFESKIGFTSIREKLKRYCLSSLGVAKVDAIQFINDREVIEHKLNLASEYKNIQQFEDNFPQSNYIDLSECLNRIKVEGTSIQLNEIVDLRKSLATIYSIVSFFNNDSEDKYPNLKNMAGEIYVNRDILVKIGTILDANNLVRDNASDNLLKIRQSISKKKNEVAKTMQSLLKTARAEGWVDKDSELSIRDGRLVIPLNTFNKRKLPGFIHDESSTGKTSYIEPTEAFETNNEILKLEYDEKREIQKILLEFTDFLRPYVYELEQSYFFLAEIDFLRANAKLAIELNAYKPILKNEQVIKIFEGKHPLLILAFAKERKEVVPLKLILEDDNRILLISGPNAGGKSVCLKTIGILQYMLQCGLMIPVSEFSEFGIFNNIFIDIGDEQSMENDLSTYSSHLVNMRHFLRYSNKNTLFLIDEFGTGTEPLLGGAIAESVLEELNHKEAFGVITTHYTNLKHFASATKGIVNGAMLFDSEQMRPLYSLSIGSPGSSFAFEIAQTIGLPKHILDSAKNKIGKEHVDFDKNLQDLEREKQYLEKKRIEIQLKENRLQDNLIKYNSKLEHINSLKKEIIDDANSKAKTLLNETNKKIENTIRTIKEANAEKKATQQVRTELEDYKVQLEQSNQTEIDKINKKIEKIKKKQDHIKNKQTKNNPSQSIIEKQKNEIHKYATGNIVVGDYVILKGQEVGGEVIEMTGKNVNIAFGSISTRVSIDKLQKITPHYYKQISKQPQKISQTTTDTSGKRLKFNAQIDVRGKRAEDALCEVQDFVEQGIVLDVKQLMILHGKGNGILRNLIRQYLATMDMVKSYSDAHIEMGGSGITIIELM